MFAKSIRGRLLLWHGLILTLVVAGFGITAYQLEYAHRFQRIDQELQERISLLATTARPPVPRGSAATGNLRPQPPRTEDQPGGLPESAASAGFEFRLPTAVASLFGHSLTNNFYYVVWQPGGHIQRSTNAPKNIPLPERVTANESQPVRMRGAMREFVHITPAGRCILVGRPVTGDRADLRRLAWLLAGAAVAVIALGLAGGWWVATRALRPIEDISATAAKIATGDLSQRINAADTDNELGRLVLTLNATFARLEAAFEQQQQFTADASHELRTPLAILISDAQMILARERTPAEYRETIGASLETARQMRKLTESLLELARFDAGQQPLHRAPLDLADLVRVAVENLRPLAVPQNLQIHCELLPAPAVADADRLSQVILNLLTNAIGYNKPGGVIRIATRSEHGASLLSIADTGPGIAPEDLPNIFKRFYRGDKTRARAQDRSGLGLAICKAIVDAHNGSLEVTSQAGAGACFTLRLAAQNERSGWHS